MNESNCWTISAIIKLNRTIEQINSDDREDLTDLWYADPWMPKMLERTMLHKAGALAEAFYWAFYYSKISHRGWPDFRLSFEGINTFDMDSPVCTYLHLA